MFDLDAQRPMSQPLPGTSVSWASTEDEAAVAVRDNIGLVMVGALTDPI